MKKFEGRSPSSTDDRKAAEANTDPNFNSCNEKQNCVSNNTRTHCIKKQETFQAFHSLNFRKTGSLPSFSKLEGAVDSPSGSNKRASSRIHESLLKLKQNVSDLKKRISRSSTTHLYQTSNETRLSPLNEKTSTVSSKTREIVSLKMIREIRGSSTFPRQLSIAKEKNFPALLSILQNEETRQQFRRFLKDEYSEENVDFWAEAEDYKSNPLPDKAMAICQTFIREHAPKEVNLGYATREWTLRNAKDFKANAFVRAQLEIFQLMKKDSFLRFKAVFQLL